jgi:hypothetical protein
MDEVIHDMEKLTPDEISRHLWDMEGVDGCGGTQRARVPYFETVDAALCGCTEPSDPKYVCEGNATSPCASLLHTGPETAGRQTLAPYSTHRALS